jgi:hypothetical protein
MTGLISLPSFSKTMQDGVNSPSIEFVPDAVDVFFTNPLVSILGNDECSLAATDHALTLIKQTGLTTLFAHSAPVFKIGFYGAAIVVVTSGGVDPSQNSDGSGFGLYVALASDGVVKMLPEVALSVTDYLGWDFPHYKSGTDGTFKINKQKNVENFRTINDIMGRGGQKNLFGV